MGNPFFKFKKFTVYHDRCAMKVGTDGVLLGAWADVSHSCRVLDIGTGTGLIALMLAQRNQHATIVAVDVDADAISQATENVRHSPWSERITPVLEDVCVYTSETQFDTIVSNPPYFIDSLKCPDNQRNLARHTDSLDLASLLEKVYELLTPEGRFSIILPADQRGMFVQIAEQKGLYPSRCTSVITRPGFPSKRFLMELCKAKKEVQSDDLVVELDRHVYSEEFTALVKDFYLKM